MVKKNVNFPIETEVYKSLKKLAAEHDTTIGGAIAYLIEFEEAAMRDDMPYKAFLLDMMGDGKKEKK